MRLSFPKRAFAVLRPAGLVSAGLVFAASAMSAMSATAASAATKAAVQPKTQKSVAAANPSPASSSAAPSVSLSSGLATGVALRTQMMVTSAKSQIGVTTLYDPAYVRLSYPGGDVPMERGVCTDVVIRAFRSVGVDLQVVVHEDMVKNFSRYPRTGLSRPDTNIDHRRVRNLATFFTRTGAAVPITQEPADYLPGDVVMWDVSGLAHTGLVSDTFVPGTGRRFAIHNIGSGTQLEDILFEFPITGHYRYLGAGAAKAVA